MIAHVPQRPVRDTAQQLAYHCPEVEPAQSPSAGDEEERQAMRPHMQLSLSSEEEESADTGSTVKLRSTLSDRRQSKGPHTVWLRVGEVSRATQSRLGVGWGGNGAQTARRTFWG